MYALCLNVAVKTLAQAYHSCALYCSRTASIVMAKLAVLVAGLLLIAESQASDVEGLKEIILHRARGGFIRANFRPNNSSDLKSCMFWP